MLQCDFWSQVKFFFFAFVFIDVLYFWMVDLFCVQVLNCVSALLFFFSNVSFFRVSAMEFIVCGVA